MWLFIAFVAIFLLIGLVYVAVTLLTIPGLAEQRLGRRETFSSDAWQWQDDLETPKGRAAAAQGRRRQTRLWLDPALDMLGRERILRQTRVIDVETGRVISVEPDRRIRRRRIKSE